ncbi:MAG: hypothetical protein Q9N34_09290 [Aquificota bacterium]|nr:hypothetical protein [Aquificota bacterium]
MGVMTRTGLLTDFVAKWEDLELYEKLFKAFKEKKLSSRVAYDLRVIAGFQGPGYDSPTYKEGF